MIGRRVADDYRWLSMFVEEAERLPGRPGARTSEQIARDTVEVQFALVGEVRRALAEITQNRVEIERLEVRNEAQRVALGRVSAMADRFLAATVIRDRVSRTRFRTRVRWSDG